MSYLYYINEVNKEKSTSCSPVIKSMDEFWCLKIIAMDYEIVLEGVKLSLPKK